MNHIGGKEKVTIISTKKERIDSLSRLLLVVHIRGLVPRLKPARRGAMSLKWRLRNLLQEDLRSICNWRFPARLKGHIPLADSTRPDLLAFQGEKGDPA